MRKNILLPTLSVCILILSLTSMRVWSQTADVTTQAPQAQIGTSFTYQGYLDDNGSPAQGNHNFQFKLYDASTGGTQIGSTINQTITVEEGAFVAILDFGADVFEGDARFLSVAVRPAGSGSYETLTPRQALTAVPYAHSLVPGARIEGYDADYAAIFLNRQSGGEGILVKAGDESSADLRLYGSSGIIDASPAHASGDIFVRSNDDITLHLNTDGPGTGDSDNKFYLRSADQEILRFDSESLWFWSDKRFVFHLDPNNTRDNAHFQIYAGPEQGTPFLVWEDGTTELKVLKINGGSDLSEAFDINHETLSVEPGIVVSIDPENAGKLTVSTEAYDYKVAGVVSGAGDIQTGMMMGQDGTIADGDYPVALTGRVYVWADATYGAIKPGDLLTTSDTPGHAMKVTNHTAAQGAILGKAMTALDKGTGLILILVTLQ